MHVNQLRAQLMATLPDAFDSATRSVRDKRLGQGSLFGGASPAVRPLHEAKPWTNLERLLYEKEALGFYLTGSPLDEYRDQMARAASEDTLVTISQALKLDPGEVVVLGALVIGWRPFTTKRKQERMAFCTLEDETGKMRGIVWPSDYAGMRSHFAQLAVVLVRASINVKDEETSLIVEKVRRMDR